MTCDTPRLQSAPKLRAKNCLSPPPPISFSISLSLSVHRSISLPTPPSPPSLSLSRSLSFSGSMRQSLSLSLSLVYVCLSPLPPPAHTQAPNHPPTLSVHLLPLSRTHSNLHPSLNPLPRPQEVAPRQVRGRGQCGAECRGGRHHRRALFERGTRRNLVVKRIGEIFTYKSA